MEPPSDVLRSTTTHGFFHRFCASTEVRPQGNRRVGSNAACAAKGDVEGKRGLMVESMGDISGSSLLLMLKQSGYMAPPGM